MSISARQNKNKVSKGGKSLVKRISGFLHLWLGISSGLIIVFLGITGCILAFEQEIRSFTEPYQDIIIEDKSFLPPSSLLPVAQKELGGRKPNGIEYREAGKSAVASYYDEQENYLLVYLNPHTAQSLKVKNMNRDFFRVVLDGHFYLWLPPEIGRPIVASATLIFVLMLISGIILWWPRNRSARKQRFALKWNASGKRLNYDLHNVLGFYASWIAIFIAVTGLVWGFDWFARSLYFVSSGGIALPVHEHPLSDSLMANRSAVNAADQVYELMKNKAITGETISVYEPATNSDAIEGAVNHRPGTYYNTDYYHFDQYTMKELEATGVYAGSFEKATIANKISRMNYDIHVGALLGLPGKILAFSASLICASLPVTGFLIWRGRRRKKKYMPVIDSHSSVTKMVI
ncbi:MAG: PepSY-associated TM helix domain-containing protein [Flavitalea sp.]